MIKNVGYFFVLLCVFFVVGCSGAQSADFEVTLLHVNDTHSHIDSSSIDLQLGGAKTRTKIGGYSQMISFIKEKYDSGVNPVLINAGDSITGTLYYTLFDGEPGAKLLNLLPWDATILGNHEFDAGDEGLLTFLNFLEVPVISANVVPQAGNILEGKWEPYRIIERDGEKIGIIGIDIVGKTQNSSNPSDQITFLDEIETAQKYADLLTEQGVNKIIVASHYGYSNEIRLAQETSNIDVVVGGDSHTLLGGDALTSVGLSPEGPYPTVVKSKTGDSVLVVQAHEYAQIVGVLSLSFDAEGIITKYEGTPVVLLHDTFRRKNADDKRVELEGDDREAVYKDIEANANLTIVQPESGSQDVLEIYRQAEEITNEYKDQLKDLQEDVIGAATEEIPGGSKLRIPSPENPQGHFTAAVTAQAFLEELQSMGKGNVDGVIQNAGGVRTPISKGDITYSTAYTLLPFANTLYLIQLTGEQIRNTLEDAVEYALSPDGSSGAFPYTAGIRYSVDITDSKEKGSRISDIEVETDSSWNPIDMDKLYMIGVNSYIAGGKDGYITLGEVAKEEGRGTDTYLDYANSFVNYVQKYRNIAKPETTNVTVQF
ncbi:NAD nucleotidase [Candidatus Haliotispira prima]|uniref:NAD nucleotidase n=1 Tax=Candidatus Haliotispira prima TaxID=3034016 RepID=A0ABY8MJG5_9SPIO|nr:NAD nucleotidase [Candidatus Haliotispira prima]